MSKIKLIFGQTLLISFLSLVVIMISGIIYHFEDGSFGYSWDFPASIVATSFFASLPTLLLFIKAKSKAAWRMLVVVHFFLVSLCVMSFGYIFKWYTKFYGMLIVFASCTVIYVIVWAVTILMFKHDEKMINSALEGMRDCE